MNPQQIKTTLHRDQLNSFLCTGLQKKTLIPADLNALLSENVLTIAGDKKVKHDNNKVETFLNTISPNK